MIIIKIIILYFIQIRHTDDFPSTGTRLVVIMLSVYICCQLRQPCLWRNRDFYNPLRDSIKDLKVRLLLLLLSVPNLVTIT